MGKKIIMKSISESIIGRKSTPKVLRSFKDLRYGDVIEINNELDGVTMAYIYMPMKLIKRHTYNSYDFDGFITYKGNVNFRVSFWRSSEFIRAFPEHEDWGSLVKISRYITHINEWQSISGGDDIKKLFDKYNIPTNETH